MHDSLYESQSLRAHAVNWSCVSCRLRPSRIIGVCLPHYWPYICCKCAPQLLVCDPHCLVRRVIDCAPPQHYFRSALAPSVDRIIQSAALPAIFARGPLTNGPAHHKWCSLPHYLCAAFVPFGVHLYTVRPFRTICMWGPLQIFVNYYDMIITMEFPP